MRWRLIPIAALMCAMPAQGADVVLSQRAIDVLTPIDTLPSQAAVTDALRPNDALQQLQLIARDTTGDLGVALRAIRMLPAYCPQGCGAGTAVHETLTKLIDDYAVAPIVPNTP